MKAQTTISLLIASAMVLASASVMAQGRNGQGGAQAPQRAQVERGQRDFDRDRMRDRDRTNDPAQDRKRDRDQDRTNAPDNAQMKQQGDAQMKQQGIYGGELMSEQERNQYREQLRLTESDSKNREKFMAQHQEKMQKRAKEQGTKIPDPPADNNKD